VSALLLTLHITPVLAAVICPPHPIRPSPGFNLQQKDKSIMEQINAHSIAFLSLSKFSMCADQTGASMLSKLEQDRHKWHA
jgi:hypothetical protein